MIYDCFIFNSELDLLEMRLAFLESVVDKFVIVESMRTLSGKTKPLYFDTQKNRFAIYEKKIIHLVAPSELHLNAWEYEYFQRNYIKQALKECKDDDIVLISDVDEIVNLPEILKMKKLRFPILIELPVYYYFYNLKSTQSFAVNLLCRYAFIKDKEIGERNDTYPTYVQDVLKDKQVHTGWHFSYLFGTDVFLYQQKISSFSHQEYNTPFFLSKERILRCIRMGVDLFERNYLLYFFKDPKKECQQLFPLIQHLGLDHLIYKPSFSLYFKKGNLSFYLSKKIFPILLEFIYRKPRMALLRLTSPLRKVIKTSLL